MDVKRIWETGLVRSLMVAALMALATSAAATVPNITSPNQTTFIAGVPNTFTLTTTGAPTPGIIRRGKKPPTGITFVDNQNGTGTLAGTPPAGSGGNTGFKFVASNSSGKDTQNFTLKIVAAPAFTSAASTSCAIGVACTFTVTAGGVPASSIVRTGDALPGGMNYSNNNNGTGTLSGTPAPNTDGVHHFTFTATNSVTTVVQNFTLTINKFLAITSAASTTCIAGTACTFTVTSTGIPTATVTLSGGTMPAGMNFVTNAGGTATMSGPPAVGTGGIHNLVLTAKNGVEPDVVQNFTLTVNEAPSITSANATSCAIGVACAFDVTTLGYPVPTVTQGGAGLPNDLLYFDNGNGTGSIDGVPAVGTNGPYALTFTASNGIGANAVQNFTLTINLSLAITSANAATCVVGTACTFTVTTNGVPVPSIVRTGGALPSGVNYVDNGNGTATFSGMAVAGTGGGYNYTLTASNGVEANAVQSFTLTVNQAPLITSAAGVTCTVGVSCSFTITTTGFPTAAINNSGVGVPGALSLLDNGDGTASISGTPSAGTAGTYNLLINATNGVAPVASQPFALVVLPVSTLTVTFNASGSGQVTSSPAGIACPGTCAHDFAAGTQVTLSALPAGDSLFTGWLGGGCGTNPICIVTVNGPTGIIANFALQANVGTATLDVDASTPTTKYDPATDGLLVLRFMFGMTGSAITNGALGGTATRTTPAAVTTYLNDILPTLDIDGDGNVDALTDGLLIVRYLLGVRGDALLAGAVAVGATRTTVIAIEAVLAGLTPP